MTDNLNTIYSNAITLIRRFNTVVYIVIALFIMSLDYYESKMTVYFKSSVIDKNVFITKHYTSFENNVKLYVESIYNYFALYKENQKLIKEKQVLENYYILTKKLEEENAALRKLMNYIPEKNVEHFTTKILADMSNPFSTSLMINGGEQQGVTKGQVVINEFGIVGRVIEVTSKNSRVMLINDLNSHIPILTEKSRERAIVSGTHNYNLLKLIYLPDDTKVQVGEMVFTSGDGKVFPAGMLIGTISHVKNNEFYVTPAIDFSRLDYVILVKY
ncbi:MAG: rod shape-determining protein MreC [Sphingobacteriia bacterium]|nr:rod shape-determining protein MreC [Sphingobacteriia bacterium]